MLFEETFKNKTNKLNSLFMCSGSGIFIPDPDLSTQIRIRNTELIKSSSNFNQKNMIRNVYPGCRIPDPGSATLLGLPIFYRLSNFDIFVTCMCIRLAANEIEKHSRDRDMICNH